MTQRLDIKPFASTVVTSLDEKTRDQAVDGGQLSIRIQRLYSLALVDTTKTIGDNIVQFPGIDPGGKGRDRLSSGKGGMGGGNFAEFFFRVPPKVHEMDEPFATTIVPTQNGGKYVESHGSILKNVRVSGTTGLRPNKRGPTTIPLLGITTEALSNLIPGDFTAERKLPEGEVTGFDDIIFLRNLFRLYSDRKADDTLAGRTIMVWRNAKDLDYWIVEPVGFKLTQSSSNPMTYEYNIQLRTLARFEFNLRPVDDPLQDILARRRFLARLQEYAFNLQRVVLSIANGIDRLDGIGVFAVNTLLGPAVSLARGILAIKESISKFGSRTVHAAQTLLDNLSDALQKIAGVTEQTNLLTPTAPDIVIQYPNLQAPDEPGVTVRFPLQDPLVRDLRRLQVTTTRILTEKTLQDTVAARASQQRDRFVRKYALPTDARLGRGTPYTAGSSTFLGNSPPPTSVIEVIVRKNETVRDIAQRCLGDRGRWHELVVLNDLRAPYISDTESVGVLVPGDVILCPAEGPIGFDASQININNTTTKDMDNQDESRTGPVQRAYGRDLRLRTVTVATDVDLTDLVVGQDGDLSTITGIPNVNQAVKLKFATEQGELTTHQFYGSQFPLGSKATSTAFTTFELNVRNTLTSDTRVDSIEDLTMTLVEDIVVVAARLRLIDGNDLLSTDFALRRF
jgi:hypothetical protein